MDLAAGLSNINRKIAQIPSTKFCGTVVAVHGILVKCRGLNEFLAVGYKCYVKTRQDRLLLAEVTGFEGQDALLLLFEAVYDVGIGCKVYYEDNPNVIYPHANWQGRVLDSFANPIDRKVPLELGTTPYSLRNVPLSSYQKKRVGQKVPLQVKVIDCFTPCCEGQRMGIFSGSGVGKSILISMLTKFAEFDVKIIGLIGERGREVQEFIEDYLGEEGLKKAVIIVATSDQAAMARRQAAYLTLTVAEYFRDQGKRVLCIIDSITRFAMAQREIGLASGEPSTTKGYPPTVFSELPRLLERAGPGNNEGSITGLFSVLVENDEYNEPISDTVRGILDGHIMLDRAIAERGRFPAVNILKSISRTLPGCNSAKENSLINQARRYIATYTEMEDMIKIGAYRRGTDYNIDLALQYYPLIEEFLQQTPEEAWDMQSAYKELARIINYDFS